MTSILVVDVGTSGVRAAVVGPDGAIDHTHYIQVLPSSPAPGFVEFDAGAMAAAVLEVTGATLAASGPVEGVGIANQRGSTIVWDRGTGEPVGPGIGWQDLRTVGTCLVLRDQGIRVAPNESATKISMLLDMADPDRSRDLCVGTVDTWVAWTLSGGALHVTDATNAGITGLLSSDGSGWDDTMLDALRIPLGVLPLVVDSSGAVGEASALPGAPVICGIAGDQQASLVGQGCTRPGLAKATFGTGGMLDLCVGDLRPGFARRGGAGTFPIVAWQRAGHKTWGVEAVMLSAGMCVEWLRDDLGIIEDAADSHRVASACEDTGDVFFVPALLGLGAPVWDFGARGTFVGITRRQWTARDGARRARGRSPPRRRSARVGRSRHRHDHRDVEGGRWHVGQPHLRRRPGRRGGKAGGDLTGDRSHHARCRLSGRHRPRGVGRRGRRGCDLESGGRDRAPRLGGQADLDPGQVAGGAGTGHGHGARAECPGVLNRDGRTRSIVPGNAFSSAGNVPITWT